jgi:hypothetical protein
MRIKKVDHPKNMIKKIDSPINSLNNPKRKISSSKFRDKFLLDFYQNYRKIYRSKMSTS